MLQRQADYALILDTLFRGGHFRIDTTVRLQASDQLFGRFVADTFARFGDWIRAIDTLRRNLVGRDAAGIHQLGFHRISASARQLQVVRMLTDPIGMASDFDSVVVGALQVLRKFAQHLFAGWRHLGAVERKQRVGGKRYSGAARR